MEALRAQNLQLRATLEASLQQLATHNAVSVTSPAHVPPPQKIQSQQQGIAVLSVESTSNGTGFDAGFAEPSHSSSGFVEPSGSGDFKSFETDGFHSFGASSTPADGFAAFSGAQGSVTSAHNDGFAAFGGDDFGSSAQPSTGFDNGFGNFGGDGFSSFGQSSTGFAAFEAPASTSQASSAFDAFNF